MKQNSSKNNAINKILMVIFGIIFLFVIYELFYLGIKNTNILPSLKEIFNQFGILFIDKITYISLGYSLLRTILSILIAFLIGTVLGVLTGLFNKLEYFLKPLITLCKCIPVPCFIYLLFIFFLENKDIAVIIVTFLIIFPIIYESSKSGIQNIDNNIILALRLDGGLYKANSIFKVLLKEDFPYILLSLVSSGGLAIKVEITSEILLGSHNIKGIGRSIFLAKDDLNFAKLYALVLFIVFIFVVIDIINYFIKKIIKKIN